VPKTNIILLLVARLKAFIVYYPLKLHTLNIRRREVEVFFVQRIFLMVYNIPPHCSLELFLAVYPELNKFVSPTYVLILKTLQNSELL